MIKINIAGAGAGKTTKIVDKIIKQYESCPSHMNVYCIAYTNDAIECICNKLMNTLKTFPKNIKIYTIHSFLYNEIIQPYNYLIYKKHYIKISLTKLDPNPKWKNYKISWLNENNILHVDSFTEVAKWIIYKKSDNKKYHNEIRKTIIDNLKSYCHKIFIDEAQDIDKNTYYILKSLDEININIELMGDPKQDLRGNNAFSELIDEYKDMGEKLKYINICYRCPQLHLNLSNSLVRKEEWQKSATEMTGNISLLFESSINVKNIINKYDLKYISCKNDRYDTHNKLNNNNFIEEISDEIVQIIKITAHNFTSFQINKIAYNLSNKIINSYSKNNNISAAIAILSKQYSIDKKNYANLASILTINQIKTTNKINVNSIDAIKGREGINCLFILTPDLYYYFCGKKLEDNKIKNKLYVALTRSLDKLTILITKETEEKFDRQEISKFIKHYL